MLSQIQFDEGGPSYRSRETLGRPETSKIIQFLVNKKISKNEKSAMFLLILLTVVFSLLTIFVIKFYILGSKSNPEQEKRVNESFKINAPPAY